MVQLVGSLRKELADSVSSCRLLVVGAGGIGCELLKNLVLTGFRNIEVIDLDTIDVSNLNRQFLFQKKHVGKSKAQVAKESVLRFCPKANITAYHDSIMNPDYNVEFFRNFSLVMNALDNRAARNHVNRMCLAADIPLIESGTAGYLGQVTVIKKGLTECYECQPKPTQKTFPGCTIRNTPSEPIHCIVWAKYLFNQLFGEEDELTKVGSKTTLNRRDTYRRRQMQRTVTRQMSFDLTKLLVTEDWFSDISPQTMRRLLNIVSVTGRLLRANQITFNWDRLASWINLTEQWPYRTSWLILYLEETDGIPDQATLKCIYERISKNIPTTKDVEPLLEIDGDVRSFEVFLSSRTPVLGARDIKTFLPCTVNLDPKLREIISDVRAAREQVTIGGPYPTLPLQDAPPRAPS